jgi:DNA-binding transcriptional MerR regulator
MQMKPLGFALEEMRELLQTLDDGGPAERLAHYRAAAAERVAALRAQLATAEAFADRLRT